MSNCCFKRSFEAQMTNISIYCKSLCWRLRHKSDYPILSSGSLTHSWKATSIWAPKKESTVTRRRSIDQRWIPDEPRGSCKLLGLCHVTLKMPRPPPPSTASLAFLQLGIKAKSSSLHSYQLLPKQPHKKKEQEMENNVAILSLWTWRLLWFWPSSTPHSDMGWVAPSQAIPFLWLTETKCSSLVLSGPWSSSKITNEQFVVILTHSNWPWRARCFVWV